MSVRTQQVDRPLTGQKPGHDSWSSSSTTSVWLNILLDDDPCAGVSLEREIRKDHVVSVQNAIAVTLADRPRSPVKRIERRQSQVCRRRRTAGPPHSIAERPRVSRLPARARAQSRRAASRSPEGPHSSRPVPVSRAAAFSSYRARALSAVPWCCLLARREQCPTTARRRREKRHHPRRSSDEKKEGLEDDQGGLSSRDCHPER